MASLPQPALGSALHLFRAGRLEQAALHCAAALRQRPLFPEALHLLGAIRGQQGNHKEAADLLARASTLQPGSHAIWKDLGFALWALKRYEPAAASYRKAIALRPRDATLHSQLGHLLLESGQPDAATASLETAKSLDPRDRAVHGSLGLALMRARQYDAAIACFQALLAKVPDFADGHYNLGLALKASGRLDEAIMSFRRACEIDSMHVHALNDLGNTLKMVQRHDEALEAYEKVLTIRPDDGNALSMSAYMKLYLCDWHNLETREAAVADALRSKRALIVPFVCLTISDDSSLQQLCARQYWASRNIGHGVRATAPTRGPDTLRLGYLSADFREHATAYLMAELFEEHDRSRFQVSAFSYGVDDGSAMRGRLEQAFDEFFDLRTVSDARIAQLVRRQQIDILIDLKGFTAEGRLQVLADRAAPIQVHYLGYPGTLGAGFIDYMIVDRFVVPPDQAQYYSENLIYLPRCYQVNDRKRPIDPSPQYRRDHGLPDGAFVFCCFNNNFKITPPIFDVWMRLLQNVRGSVLWLLADNEWAERNLRREAGDRGIDPRRLIFAARESLPRHLARHRLADLFLDTVPCNAHTTASDSLWAGLPLLTLAGRSFAARVAGSLLHAVGLPELVTETLAEYEQAALRLAHQPKELQAIRRRLQNARSGSALFDTDRMRRDLEAAYLQMWDIKSCGEAPRSFCVAQG
jgi:predicted O-linked N-acetylglucosamine transferase (SPINDLY family)